ncbi:MAG: nucleotide exchange factor GrpE [Parvularculaceae bacterium]|nr:nucleotide exchange factor GrpE [Parvularculaceae bacterium]
MKPNEEYQPNDDQPDDGVPPLVDGPEAEIIAALEGQISELNDRVLRIAAELENTRRRGEREKQDASRYAIASFARDLVNVADIFDRALQTLPSEVADASAETLSSFASGVRMTERSLAAALERHGVKKIDPKGEKFDPNLHQAVAQAPAAGIPAGYVAETAQTGFVIGDRVLRAAMVIVSTGEPAASSNGTPGSTHVDTTA